MRFKIYLILLAIFGSLIGTKDSFSCNLTTPPSAGTSFTLAHGGVTYTGPIVLDASWNIYVANDDNLVVESFSSAGTWRWEFDPSDNALGLAINSAGTTIYNVNRGINYIDQINPSDGTSLGFFVGVLFMNGPIAVDSSGNIFFSDDSAHIYKYTSAGVSVTSVNEGNSVDGLFVGSNGTVYSLDGNSNNAFSYSNNLTNKTLVTNGGWGNSSNTSGWIDSAGRLNWSCGADEGVLVFNSSGTFQQTINYGALFSGASNILGSCNFGILDTNGLYTPYTYSCCPFLPVYAAPWDYRR